MSRVVHVPYSVEQDKDGAWCAMACVWPGVGAYGDGGSREEAVAQLSDALVRLIEEIREPLPPELTLTVDVD